MSYTSVVKCRGYAASLWRNHVGSAKRHFSIERIVLCLASTLSVTNLSWRLRNYVVVRPLQECGKKKTKQMFVNTVLLEDLRWQRQNWTQWASCEDKYAIVSLTRHGQEPRDLGLIVVRFFYSLFFRFLECVWSLLKWEMERSDWCAHVCACVRE